MLILLNTLNSIKIGSFMTSETVPDTARVSLLPAYSFRWGTTADNAYVSLNRNGGFYTAGNTSSSSRTFFYTAEYFYSNRQWNANAVASYVDSAIFKYSATMSPNIKISKYVLKYLFPGSTLLKSLSMGFVKTNAFVVGATSNMFKFESVYDNVFLNVKSEYTITEPAFKFEAV